MLIQHFSMQTRRVPDPMRPGRTSKVGYLTASNNSELSYTDPHSEEEVTAYPDENGWIEVPHEVGQQLCGFRQAGSGFYTPAEIDDTVRLGQFDGSAPTPSEDRPKDKRTRASSNRSSPRRGVRQQKAGETGESDAVDGDGEPADIVGPED